jgi:hypothetical protein
MLDGVEVGGCVIGSYSRFVVVEHHVKDPVYTVLDIPMTPNKLACFLRWNLQGGHVETGLLLGLALDFTEAFDHDNRLQS